MKIAIATTTGFHLRHLARELIALGQDVQYVTYAPSFRIARDGVPPANARSLFWLLQPWSTAAQFRHARGLQKQAVIRMLEATDRAIANVIGPCDVFIGLSSMAVASAAAARDRFGATVVIDRGARHVLSQNALLVEGGAAPLAGTYVQRELASYEVADFIAVPSRHAAASFVERGVPLAKLFHNPYGVDLGAFRPTPPPSGPNRVLFVGGWTRQKGVDVLVEAIDRLPDVMFTHVGTKGDVPYLKHPRFTGLGYRDHDQLARIMSEHHVLVLPSRQDGFGMVLLEALASGLGVVGTQFTGAPDIAELIERKAFVKAVEAGSSEALASGLSEMITEVRSCGSREILTASEHQRFSWRGYADRYLAWLGTIR